MNLINILNTILRRKPTKEVPNHQTPEYPLLSPKGVVIFDGDDTLWKTQELYDRAKKDFQTLVDGEIDFYEDLIKWLDDLDASRVDIRGFSRSRFVESMLITYAMLRGASSTEPNPSKKWDLEVEREIRNIADQVFRKPEMYSDTLSVLRSLYKDYILVLYTAGDKHIQEEKIKSLGREFASFFTMVHICDIKNENELKYVIKSISPIATKSNNIWMVGNSMRSDINPAMRQGLKTILIPNHTWKYEEDLLCSGKFIVAKSLTEAADVIIKDQQ